MDKNKQYRRYGLILKSILEYYPQTNKKDLHISLKEVRGIDSLTKLTAREMWEHNNWIVGTMAMEYGVYIRDAGEDEGVEGSELKDHWA